MAHHAYLYAGERTAGIAAVRAFADAEGIRPVDCTVFEYGLFSVDDARDIARFVSQAPVGGDKKLVGIATGRIFHEAQNALLKVFEEPAEGTVVALIVPVEGMVLPTLRSRLISLPSTGATEPHDAAAVFLAMNAKERETSIAKLLQRARSDKDTEKQAARLEAVTLVSGITHIVYELRKRAGNTSVPELDLLLNDLTRFMPLLHERAAPLKPLFEHLLIVLPSSFDKYK